MLSARQLGIYNRPRFIKSSEIMSRQTTVDSLLLSVAAGQPSDSIVIVCSNESTFWAKSTIAYCMQNNIRFHWQMSNVSPQTVTAARTIFIVTWLGFRRMINMACTDHFTTLHTVWRNNPLGGAFNLAVKLEKVTTLNAWFRIQTN